jgi:sec-independent protein translocase protein TatB
MFDIGWSELIVIGIVALIAIGPKELPGALRTLGHWMGKIRRMASEFQDQFREAMREAELADLKKEVDDMAATASSYSQFDPMADVRRDVENSLGDLPALDQPEAQAEATPQPDTAIPPPAQASSSLPIEPTPLPAGEAGASANEPPAGARESA